MERNLSWKLKLNFSDSLKELSKVVNRIYFKESTLKLSLDFYMVSGLLKDNVYEITTYEDGKEIMFEKLIWEKDESDKYSF